MTKNYAVSYGMYKVERFVEETEARAFLAENGGVLFKIGSMVEALADSQGDFEVSPYTAQNIVE